MDALGHRQSPTNSAEALALPVIARFRFLIEAQEDMPLPAYSGSAWRGLLGRSLRRLVCVTAQPSCEACLLKRTCLYSTFFETPGELLPEGGRYSALPHPFVLEPEVSATRVVPAGGRLHLGIVLIGEIAKQVPYLIHALNLAGQWGFGRARAGFRVQALEQEMGLGSEHWESVYTADAGVYDPAPDVPCAPPPAPPATRVELLTPLRLKREGRFLGAADFDIGDLLRNLTARHARLAALYGSGSTQGAVMVKVSVELQLDARRLRWHEWTRFSSRQSTLMQMGGLLGDFQLSGPGLPDQWTMLWYGQWTHAGKGTSFGLGRYRLSALAEDTAPGT